MILQLMKMVATSQIRGSLVQIFLSSPVTWPNLKNPGGGNKKELALYTIAANIIQMDQIYKKYYRFPPEIYNVFDQNYSFRPDKESIH